MHYHNLLLLPGDTNQTSFVAQALFIDTFQESRPENPMNFYRSTDDFVSQLFVVEKIGTIELKGQEAYIYI